VKRSNSLCRNQPTDFNAASQLVEVVGH